jgi:hypothetical protein
MKRLTIAGVAALLLLAGLLTLQHSGHRPSPTGDRAMPVQTPMLDLAKQQIERGYEKDGDAFGGAIAPSAPGMAKVAIAGNSANRNVSTPGSLVPELVSQKIIYTGNVDLTTHEFDKAQGALMKLVVSRGGYIAQSSVNGGNGSPRYGTWKIRFASEQFDSFVHETSAIAQVSAIHSESQDVTEEYYDVEARIHAKQAEAKRLSRLLDTATGNLQEILELESQIEGVNEQIEQLEGRKNVLASLSAMSTLTVNISEVIDASPVVATIVPPAPTFFSRIAASFGGSIASIAGLAGALVLTLAALLPWLVTFGAFGGFALWAGRRWFGLEWKKAAKKSEPEAEAAGGPEAKAA